MLDFNHRPKLSEEISALINKALTKENEQQTPRDYLGASRLGVSCNRALQFEYTKTPKDEGQNFYFCATRACKSEKRSLYTTKLENRFLTRKSAKKRDADFLAAFGCPQIFHILDSVGRARGGQPRALLAGGQG